MNKKIFTIIGFLVIILVLFFVVKNISFTPTSDTGTINEKENSTTNEIELNIPKQSLPFSNPSNSPKDVAWAVFEKYLMYNKNQDSEGVKSVVYKVAPICEDPKDTIDCKARMSSAYAYGSALNKGDFVNVWNDENQTILATDFKIQEDESVIGRNRAIIYFIKDREILKMLSFSPFKGSIVSKGGASKEELLDRIILFTEDNDEDGISDYDEECLSVKEGEFCVKTNPNIRDTDGDGLWDGVEALMR